jgi:G3E family GTPase
MNDNKTSPIDARGAAAIFERYRRPDSPKPALWNDTLDLLLAHRSHRNYLDQPLPEGALESAFEMLLTLRGEQVLRVKGLVNIEGSEAPIAIHAVQHSFYPPARLARWPDADRSSRIVFIVEGLDEAFVAHTLDSFIADARKNLAMAGAAHVQP